MVAAAMIGGAVVSAGAGAYSANKAAGAQRDAANQANDTQWRMYDQQRADMQPWRQTGANALGTLANYTGISGDPNASGFGALAGSPYQGFDVGHQFNADDLKSNLAPGYDFRLQQGLGATTNAANAMGGAVSGNSLKAINDYAQGFASNEFQNAFNNYQTNLSNRYNAFNTNFSNNQANQTNIFNRLSSIAGLGQTANQATSNAGISAATNIGNNITGAGNARAAGYMGVGNAVGGNANNLATMYALRNWNQSPGTAGVDYPSAEAERGLA